MKTNSNNQIAVIFDMDGVLLDTTRFNEKSFNELLIPHELTIDILADKYGEGFRGTSLANILNVIEEDYGVYLDLDDFSKKAGVIAFELMDKEGVRGDSSIKNFLKSLQEAGIVFGLGTSSLRWRVAPILERLGITDFFDVIVAAEDVINHKPHPDVFLEVARQLGVQPEKCIVIEDARSGIEAAHNGGMKAIAFTAHNNDPLLKNDADYAVSNFSEIAIKDIEELFN